MHETTPEAQSARQSAIAIGKLASALALAGVFSAGTYPGAITTNDTDPTSPDIQTSLYYPGSEVDTAVIELHPDKQSDAVNLQHITDYLVADQSLNEINSGLRRIENTLGPDAPNFATVEPSDVAHVTVEQNGIDAEGQQCYTWNQTDGILQAAVKAKQADQYVIYPHDGEKFCETGESGNEALAALSMKPTSIILTHKKNAQNEIIEHEWGHLALGHTTNLKYSGPIDEYDFLQGPQTIQAITEAYDPYRRPDGSINMYMDPTTSMAGYTAGARSNEVIFNTSQRATLNEIHHGDPELYKTIQLEPGTTQGDIFYLTPRNKDEQAGRNDVQVLEIPLSNEHALKQIDQTIEKIAVYVDYMPLVDEPLTQGDEWLNCENSGLCVLKLAAITSGKDAYSIPKLQNRSFITQFDGAYTTGSVLYIDSDSAFALLQVAMVGKDGQQVNAIKPIKYKDLEYADSILQGMTAKILVSN